MRNQVDFAKSTLNCEINLKYTGEFRYLEFQGNGENTLSFPKFEIANYDVTRIHVHEEKKSTIIKSALLQNVCNTNLKVFVLKTRLK